MIVLDMLRASQKSEALDIIIKKIKRTAGQAERHGSLMEEKLSELLDAYGKLQEAEDRDSS